MRKTIFFALSLAASALLLAGAAGAQTLYGISFMGPTGASTLHTVSPTTGAATVVGAVGFNRCSGMDFDAAGTLFATCQRGDATPVLVTIDVTTGAGTEVGPTGISGSITDISFRADGVLYAYDGLNNPGHTLFTLNPATGAGTLVGATGLDFAGGNGMTFDLTGVLYQSQFADGPNPDLNTLDQNNGQATFVGQITPVTGRFSAMDVHPATGVIYGALNEGGSGSGPVSLATIDTAGLTATVIGLTENGLDALAFGPVPPASPDTIEVPTLDFAGLLGLILALAAAGVWWISLRRS